MRHIYNIGSNTGRGSNNINMRWVLAPCAGSPPRCCGPDRDHCYDRREATVLDASIRSLHGDTRGAATHTPTGRVSGGLGRRTPSSTARSRRSASRAVVQQPVAAAATAPLPTWHRVRVTPITNSTSNMSLAVYAHTRRRRRAESLRRCVSLSLRLRCGVTGSYCVSTSMCMCSKCFKMLNVCCCVGLFGWDWC